MANTPLYALAALEIVRDSGVTNMLDFKGVIAALERNGATVAVQYLKQHQSSYMDILNEFGSWSTARRESRTFDTVEEMFADLGLDEDEDDDDRDCPDGYEYDDEGCSEVDPYNDEGPDDGD